MEHRVNIVVIASPKDHDRYKGMTDDAKMAIIQQRRPAIIGATDPIILGKDVWCLVGSRLFKHPHHGDVGHAAGPGHTSDLFGETILVVSIRNQDSITWRCDRPFRVLSFEPVEAHPKFHAPPINPLTVEKKPFPQMTLAGAPAANEVTSGPAKASAAKTQYKITFEIDGEEVDPDVFCSP
jgi:hypothetical protein